MIEIKNVAVVTGSPNEVSRFVRIVLKEAAWEFAPDWDKPTPPDTTIDGDELVPGETQMSMDIVTDW